jgi:hypothetical protein
MIQKPIKAKTEEELNQLSKEQLVEIITALPAIMQYSFLLAPLLSSLSAFRIYLIAAGSAVRRCERK